MTAKQLFNKTRPFCMAKLALGGATVLLSLILFAILMGIGWLFGDGGLAVTFIIWIGGIGVIRLVLMHYFGYLVKAGHIAVIAETMKTGRVPSNQVNYGKQLVTERFATSNIYFAVDKLVTGAVKQIQGGIEKLGNKLDFVPGMGAVTGVAKFFTSISLGYIDECCFGWTFYNPQQGACKSAADGVVIYAQNWKVLLKDAAKTMAKTIGLTILIALLIFVPVGLICKLLKVSGFAAFIIVCLIAWVVKFAFMDSYIMCQMMVSYMQVAPTTVITFDLYSKLCRLSSKFKELFQKGQAEDPQTAYTAANTYSTPARAGYTPSGTESRPVRTGYAPARTGTIPTPTRKDTAPRPIFCSNCGTKSEPGTRFCGNCGSPI